MIEPAAYGAAVSFGPRTHNFRDVVAAIKRAGGPNLDKRTVQLPKALIKSVGTHPIALRLHADVDAAVSLSVIAESKRQS